MTEKQEKPRLEPISATGQQRLASLDFTRGIAVMGILAGSGSNPTQTKLSVAVDACSNRSVKPLIVLL